MYDNYGLEYFIDIKMGGVMTKTCPNCKTENPNNSGFCLECGTDLKGNLNSEKSSATSGDGISGFWNKQNNGGKAAIVIGVCCIGLIILVAIGGMLSPDKNTATNTTTPSTTTPATTTPATSGGITILSNSGKYDSVGVYHITGEVKNTGASDAQYVQIVGTGYDSSGNVVGTDTGYASFDTIPAGGTSPFDVMILNTNNNIVKYTVQVNP